MAGKKRPDPGPLPESPFLRYTTRLVSNNPLTQKEGRLNRKKLWILALVVAAALAPQNAFAVSAVAQQVQGEVSVAKAAAPETWNAITQDTALESGDSIKTGQGSCTLVYSDQATFNVDANTTLTVEQRTDAQDIKLLLGKIKGKVNKQNAEQPFMVTTPAAVATVRGTEVDFGFNEEGQLTVDLHNGNIQVVNEDAQMTLDLGGNKSVQIQYNKDANTLRIKNECGSDGVIKFNLLGTEYSGSPCEEKVIDLSTSDQGTQIPGTPNNPGDPEQPDEGRKATDTL